MFRGFFPPELFSEIEYPNIGFGPIGFSLAAACDACSCRWRGPRSCASRCGRIRKAFWL